MTDEEYRSAAIDVVYLAACAVDGVRPDPARVARMDLTALYQTADRHLLTGITAMALESAGVRDEAFLQAKGKAVRKVAAFDLERAAVLAELEKAGIWYMPLKGCILKDCYPKLGMRQMADNDILCDASRSGDIRRIMEALGFETERYAQDKYNDQYKKRPVCFFEMHRALFPAGVGDAIYRYYLNIRSKMLKDEDNGCGYHLSPEDFYVYITAHEYKHYSKRGTGLRSLLDIYVFLRSKGGTLDRTYIAKELDQLGLGEFEERNRGLAMHLFGGEKLSAEEEEMLDYILSSGTYGTIGNQVSNSIRKKGNGVSGKLRYSLSRVFLPMDLVRTAFPLFARYPVLLPFLPAYRLFRGLKGGRGRLLRAELKALAKHSPDRKQGKSFLL